MIINTLSMLEAISKNEAREMFGFEVSDEYESEEPEMENETEIPSSKIGEMVMQALEKLDKVAFVRFASVYKNFEKPDDFQKFIKQVV